jgi:predicted RNA binding protein YcfA (HicA-like mRNA interferase family)
MSPYPWSPSMPPKLTSVSWQTLVRIFEADGFKADRTRGSHIVMTKPGILRPVVIPKYDELGPDIILSNLRTAKMSRERYFELLNKLH